MASVADMKVTAMDMVEAAVLLLHMVILVAIHKAGNTAAHLVASMVVNMAANMAGP